MASSSNFPRQDLPLYEKRYEDGRLKETFAKEHLDFAEGLIYSCNARNELFSRLYNSFNGVKAPNSLAYLEKNYGKQNKSKYIGYRLGRTKMNLLKGEFLQRPLAGTVTTINAEAMSEKMRQMDMIRGAMIAKDALNDIKQVAGIDVTEGMKIPSSEEEFEKLSPKDKEEVIMQIILDESVKELKLKQRLSQCFLDLLITAMCYCKVTIDEEGNVSFNRIDPRDAIYQHIEGDDYLKQSPIRGCRQRLPVHEILLRYNLTPEQRIQLDNARINPEHFAKQSGGWARIVNGQLMCDVIHIEWDSVETLYFEKSPKTKIQMDIDPSKSYREIEIFPEKSKEDFDVYQKNVKEKKSAYKTKFKSVTYESTRIGGCIDINCRVKYFQPRSVDDPTKVLTSSYHGYIHETVDGVKISMQQIIENFDNLFDILMYQRNRTIAQAKGKVLFYDRAGMPSDKGMNLKQIMYQAHNDGYIDWNSAASGNYSQKNLDITNAIKEIDLGLSASFEYTTNALNQVVAALDKITGINDNRQGDIAASSTATNANSSIQASRTITEPIFFGMNGLIEDVMQTVVDLEAISWAFYKIDKGEHILGSEKHKYLQISKKLGYKNYGVHIQDGGKYAEIRQIMKEAMLVSLNAKEIRPIDFFKASIAETLAEAKSIYQSSWTEMQEASNKANQENIRAKQEIEQAKMQQQIQLGAEDREDRQKQSAEEILLQGQVQKDVDNNKARNEAFLKQHEIENDLLNNT